MIKGTTLHILLGSNGGDTEAAFKPYSTRLICFVKYNILVCTASSYFMHATITESLPLFDACVLCVCVCVHVCYPTVLVVHSGCPTLSGDRVSLVGCTITPAGLNITG